VDRRPGAEPFREENLEHHYRLTWVDFDMIEVLAIGLTAYLAFRLDARVLFPATVMATLLVVDAWFDVTTSTNSNAATGALILALAVELPTAALSLYVASRVARRVREQAHLGHVTGLHQAVPEQSEAGSALPPEPSTPAELPPDE
jgi:hypothetical protein